MKTHSDQAADLHWLVAQYIILDKGGIQMITNSYDKMYLVGITVAITFCNVISVLQYE